MTLSLALTLVIDFLNLEEGFETFLILHSLPHLLVQFILLLSLLKKFDQFDIVPISFILEQFLCRQPLLILVSLDSERANLVILCVLFIRGLIGEGLDNELSGRFFMRVSNNQGLAVEDRPPLVG